MCGMVVPGFGSRRSCRRLVLEMKKESDGKGMATGMMKCVHCIKRAEGVEWVAGVYSEKFRFT